MGLLSYAVEQFGKKAIESGVEHVAEHAVASKVASAAASEVGQTAITRYAGERAASAAASTPGQFAIKRLARNAITPNRADHSGDQPAAAPATTPNINLQQTIQTSVRKAMSSGSSGGRGAGWWNMMQQPGDDWRQIGDLSVGRGPAHWDLPSPGPRTAAFVGGAIRAGAKLGAKSEPSYNGQPVSDTDISQINANLRTYGQPLPQPPSSTGTGPRAQAFDLGKDYVSRNPVGSFSTWPQPPTSEQTPGQVTPYKRSGPWVTSQGGSFT